MANLLFFLTQILLITYMSNGCSSYFVKDDPNFFISILMNLSSFLFKSEFSITKLFKSNSIFAVVNYLSESSTKLRTENNFYFKIPFDKPWHTIFKIFSLRD